MELQAGLVTYEDLSIGDYLYTRNIDIVALRLHIFVDRVILSLLIAGG